MKSCQWTGTNKIEVENFLKENKVDYTFDNSTFKIYPLNRGCGYYPVRKTDWIVVNENEYGRDRVKGYWDKEWETKEKKMDGVKIL